MASIFSMGAGGLNKKPCISSHFRPCKSLRCASVSTPSAITFSLSECAKVMIVDTILRSSALCSMASTNDRSILSVLTGSFEI